MAKSQLKRIFQFLFAILAFLFDPINAAETFAERKYMNNFLSFADLSPSSVLVTWSSWLIHLLCFVLILVFPLLQFVCNHILGIPSYNENDRNLLKRNSCWTAVRFHWYLCWRDDQTMKWFTYITILPGVLKVSLKDNTGF